MKEITNELYLSGEAGFYNPNTGSVFVYNYERVRRAAEKVNKILREESECMSSTMEFLDIVSRNN